MFLSLTQLVQLFVGVLLGQSFFNFGPNTFLGQLGTFAQDLVNGFLGIFS